MKHSIILIVLLICSCATLPKNQPDKEDWIQIFNGHDLTGWDIKIRGHELNDNYANTFQVNNGTLTVVYDSYEKFDETFGHIFYEQPYGYYRLRTEYRFVGEQVTGGPGWAFRNNGLMLHSQSARTMGLDQDFPISIEVQLLGGSGEGERSTANLCTPGTHVVMDGQLLEQHCINSTSNTYHGDQWVNMEVVVLGDSLMTHIVEGETVLSYSKPRIGGGVVNGFDEKIKVEGRALTSGFIALQGESHPTEFRKIEVLNLEGCMDRNAKNYKSYFIKDKRSMCQY